MKLNFKNRKFFQELTILIVLFCIVFLFSIYSRPSLIPKWSPDGYGYLSVSQDFSSDFSNIRPFFFPLIIKICHFISFNNWQIYFSLLQMTLHSLMVLILFKNFQEFNLSTMSSFFCSIIIGFNPSLLYYSTYILADFTLAILTTLCWIFLLRLDFNKKDVLIYAILASVFSGLCIVTKPISLIMIVPIIITIYFLNGISNKIIKISVIMILINFSFHYFWNEYKDHSTSNANKRQLDIMWGGFNMTAIRGGLIDLGEGTKLYKAIEKEGFLDKAKDLKIKFSYTMDTNPDYLDVYYALGEYTGWDRVKLLNDKEFAMQVIRKAPFSLFFYSISNWHSFFTKRSFNPSFPTMPKFFKKIYDTIYAVLYRPLLLILLITSFIYMFVNKNLSPLYISLSIILYSSLILAIMTPHGGEFPRYRVWVEYIMWFCALVPFGLALDRIYSNYFKMKKI